VFRIGASAGNQVAGRGTRYESGCRIRGCRGLDGMGGMVVAVCIAITIVIVLLLLSVTRVGFGL